MRDTKKDTLFSSRQCERPMLRRKPMKSFSPKSQHGNSKSQVHHSQLRPKLPINMAVECRAKNVVACLRRFGMAVIDNFLGESIGMSIRKQCELLKLTDGLTFTASNSSSKHFRQDRIAWVHGSEPQCNTVSQLLSALDKLITRVGHELLEYNIKGRTPAMVACYEGNESHYVRHVDNPRRDGRVLTCIYYLNPDWQAEKDGGVLRVYPTPKSAVATAAGACRVACVEPILDRLVIFWSDCRTPHEVLPAYRNRYAVTAWYFDKQEREQALNRLRGIRKTQPSKSPSNETIPEMTTASEHLSDLPSNNIEDETINVVDLDCPFECPAGQLRANLNEASQPHISFNEDASPMLGHSEEHEISFTKDHCVKLQTTEMQLHKM